MERHFIGVERRRETSYVRNILTERLLTGNVHARQHFIGVVLLDEPLARLLKMDLVFGCPPILELSCRVKFSARVVEAVTDFMADGCADRTVICSGISFRVEI